MNPQPKNKPWRSPIYRKWMTQQVCCICGTNDGVHGHHEAMGFREKGIATKYPDVQMLPMCDGECHRQRTDWKGKWYDFYLAHNVNPVRVMVGCINRYLQERGIK
jgi:hypothetical protein